jgi:leukotriene-A4 hydrolase
MWTIPKAHALGHCLYVPLPEGKRAKGSNLHFRVHYATTPESGGIQWLEPSQTAGKRHPFAYTQVGACFNYHQLSDCFQCEAILARTLLPCQDSPAVKCPYDVTVTVPSPLVACCSGHAVGKSTVAVPALLTFNPGPVLEEDGWLSYAYSQKVPIPAYLIAIVVGRLEKAAVGPRSSVWTEGPLLAAAINEFSADTGALFLRLGAHMCWNDRELPEGWREDMRHPVRVGCL